MLCNFCPYICRLNTRHILIFSKQKATNRYKTCQVVFWHCNYIDKTYKFSQGSYNLDTCSKCMRHRRSLFAHFCSFISVHSKIGVNSNLKPFLGNQEYFFIHYNIDCSTELVLNTNVISFDDFLIILWLFGIVNPKLNMSIQYIIF